MVTGCTVTFVTCESQENAEEVAEHLVREKLAACVNVLPGITSFFFWEGSLSREKEVLLVIKSREDLQERLVSRVRELHTYSVPEVVSVPIVAGSADYLRWVRENTA